MKGYKITLIITVIFILISCTAEKETYDSIEAPRVQVHLISEIVDNEEFVFGRISDAEITTNGSILLLDYNLQKIHIFDSTGNYVSSFLKEGRGPGEIQRMSGRIAFNDEDRLLLYDQMQRRFSFYQFENNEIEYIRDLNMDIFPSRFHLTPNDKLVLYKTARTMPEDKTDFIVTANDEGEIENDSLITFNTSGKITINNESGFPMMSISTPHHARNLIEFHGDKMIYSKSTQIGFRIYDLNSGEIVNEVVLNRPDFEFPFEDRRVYVEDLIEQVGFGADQKSKLISDMPTTKGKITRMHYDSAGFVWLNIVNENKTDWVVFSENGELIGSYTFDEENVVNITKNHIFIYAEDENGMPSLKIYRYEIAN